MKNVAIILASILGLIKIGQAQQLNWKQTENWRIYDIVDRQAMKITIDSLKLLKGIPIQKDSVLYFLFDAIVWPTTKDVVWMGAYTLSYEFKSKQTRKLLVSSSGEFMYDFFSKHYYEIDIQKKYAWQAFLISHLNKKINE